MNIYMVIGYDDDLLIKHSDCFRSEEQAIEEFQKWLLDFKADETWIIDNEKLSATDDNFICFWVEEIPLI